MLTFGRPIVRTLPFATRDTSLTSYPLVHISISSTRPLESRQYFTVPPRRSSQHLHRVPTRLSVFLPLHSALPIASYATCSPSSPSDLSRPSPPEWRAPRHQRASIPKQHGDVALKAHVVSICFICFRGMLQCFVSVLQK
jgi:hypothetical protein